MTTLFGSVTVGTMLVSYWLEPRSRWFILSFSLGCVATAVYSAIVEAWPIMVIEAILGAVALRRFTRSDRDGHAV
jgi:hypothetical protein